MALRLHSTSFETDQAIPKRSTQDGDNVSPGLVWTGVPESAKSLALIVDDPDAPDPANPKMTYVHWVLYNIPPNATAIPEGADTSDLFPEAQRGSNDAGQDGYTGPAPPRGRHRYFFKLYALDTTLAVTEATKTEVEAAMKGHVLAEAQIVGTYERAAPPKKDAA